MKIRTISETKGQTMNRIAILCLMCCVLTGCPSATSTVPSSASAPAKGYSSPADQQIGEALAAVNAFVNQEKVNYQAMTPIQQGKEKAALNALIASVNAANSAYTGYHAGTGTLDQAQNALTSAQNAQAALTAAKGVK